MTDLKPTLSTFENLSGLVQQTASTPRQKELQSDLMGVKDRLDNVDGNLTSCVDELKNVEQRWMEFSNKLDYFTDLISQKESELQAVQDNPNLSPEEKYRRAQVCCNI